MNKKGMTWSTIIYAIIAIIVLVVLAWMFKEQINSLYKAFMGIIKTTTAGSEEVGQGFKDIVGNK